MQIQQAKDEKITVIVPQFVTHERLGEVLHNHTSFFIRETLLKNDNIIVSTFPYHLVDEDVSELDKVDLYMCIRCIKLTTCYISCANQYSTFLYYMKIKKIIRLLQIVIYTIIRYNKAKILVQLQ